MQVFDVDLFVSSADNLCGSVFAEWKTAFEFACNDLLYCGDSSFITFINHHGSIQIDKISGAWKVTLLSYNTGLLTLLTKGTEQLSKSQPQIFLIEASIFSFR